jgi:glycosyltransferase involved in cell wall biosynthesis
VYNVELYLEECVDSILSQMTEECEIILVDDGSKDSSGAICEKYAQQDTRIKIVKKENGGLSSARNAGLSVAVGEYVAFVDSDDKIAEHSVSEILNWIGSGGSDLCFLQATKFYPDGSFKKMGDAIIKEKIALQSREDAINHLATRPKYPGSACTKLYRREFLVRNQLHFPYDRRFSEDLGFVRDCIMLAKDFDSLDIPYYLYRQNRKGSITNQISFQNFKDLVLFLTESIEKLTVNKKPKDSVSNDLMNFVAYEYGVLLFQYTMISKKEKKEALLLLKEFRWTLKYALSPVGKLIALFITLFGIRFTAFLIKEYRKVTDK